ncbi:hypothetical protein pb186bvf_007854 [Paramecium bursaria]
MIYLSAISFVKQQKNQMRPDQFSQLQNYFISTFKTSQKVEYYCMYMNPNGRLQINCYKINLQGLKNSIVLQKEMILTGLFLNQNLSEIIKRQDIVGNLRQKQSKQSPIESSVLYIKQIFVKKCFLSVLIFNQC